jgi:hypothetical protein
VLGGRETVSVECRIKLTQRGTEFTLHTWAPWTPPQGWQPAPTPATAQMPQRTVAQPAAAPQGYPAAYAPPAFAPAALPQAAPPAYAPPVQAPAPAPGMTQAPYGQPGMPPAVVLPSWMGPK